MSILARLKSNNSKFLWWLGLILFTASVIASRSGDEFLYRLMRPLIGTFYLLLLLMLHKRRTHPLMTLFLIVFNVSSVLSIWYEVNWVASVCMALNFLAYFILFVGIWPKIHFKKLGRTIGIGLISVSIIIGLLLYNFMEMIKPNALSQIHFVCTWLNALGLFILGLIVFIYNHEYNTKASLAFIFFVVFMIFSETFRGIGYYQFAFAELAIYMEKALMIASLSLLIQYSFIEKTDDEPLSLYHFKS